MTRWRRGRGLYSAARKSKRGGMSHHRESASRELCARTVGSTTTLEPKNCQALVVGRAHGLSECQPVLRKWLTPVRAAQVPLLGPTVPRRNHTRHCTRRWGLPYLQHIQLVENGRQEAGTVTYEKKRGWGAAKTGRVQPAGRAR